MMHKNYLALGMRRSVSKRYRHREELQQIMKVDNYESFLWNDDINNYKKYPIDEIAKEILWLAPFRSKELRALMEYVQKRMAITKHVKWKKQCTKPHRGNLSEAINREFIKQRSEKRKAKQQEKADIESAVVSNKVKIVANKFDMVLTKTIYNNNVPKTDAVYKEDQASHKRMIDLYESEGNHHVAQILKDNPLSPKPIYKDIAYTLKGKYLKKYGDHLPKQKLKEALRLKIIEVRKFAYPKRKHTPS